MAGIIEGVKKMFRADDNKGDQSGDAATTSPAQETGERPGIQKEDIILPPCSRGKLAFGLHNVYTKEECEEFIRLTEKRGYEEALLNVGAGRQELHKDVRNSSRCIWDSPEHAEEMFRRIKPYIPKTFNGCTVVGLNERLRFLRYDPGEYFRGHMDGTYMAPNRDRSHITVHFYLNEGYGGGSTTFLSTFSDNESHPEDVPFKSRTGSVLIFQHDILHEGSLLKEGRKYTVRTDIMYRKN